ncbi:nuclear transport factor 2 family protein [Streptomyces parvulus]|uniref:nuclear transport factor 2 family protein n=1 Tax=Streptomyces parvulus TaxID=146923 RepID=UPI0033C45B1B
MNPSTTQPVSDTDHVALQRLATEVNWRVDAGIAATLPDLFTQDGSIATFGEPSVGHEALRAWGQMMDTDKPLAGVRHVLTNFRFTQDETGRATGTFYVTAYLPGAPAGQATLPFAMGLCTDRYTHTPQGWKVTSRVFEPFFLRDQAA